MVETANPVRDSVSIVIDFTDVAFSSTPSAQPPHTRVRLVT
jgi:hypothetical protein